MRDNGTYTATIPVSQISPHPENYNGHPADQLAELQDSLRAYGYTRRIVVWKKSEDAFWCVAGEGVLSALKMEEATEIEATVIPPEWSEEDVIGYLIADNETAKMADRQDLPLAKLLARIEGRDLPVGLSPEEQRAIKKALAENGDGAGRDDAIPPEKTPEELVQEWGVEEGQIWKIGDHFVLCGDSTTPNNWIKLLGAADVQAVDGVFTSPPYAEQRKERYGGIPASEYVRWWMDVIHPLIDRYLAYDGSFFLNLKAHTEDGRRLTYDKRLILALEEAEWILFEEFIWRKVAYPGKFEKRFKNAFEPVFQLARSPEIRANIEAVFVEKDSEIHAPWAPLKDAQGRPQDPPREAVSTVRPSNVIFVNHDRTDVAGDEHPGRFPVGLPAFFVQAYSFPGDVWIDPFSGTGSTGLACHEHGQRFLGLDLDPSAVATTLQRFLQDHDLRGELYV